GVGCLRFGGRANDKHRRSRESRDRGMTGARDERVPHTPEMKPWTVQINVPALTYVCWMCFSTFHLSPMTARQYWLVKSEPEVFSFDDLVASPKKTTHWNGVRNFAARNHLRSMKTGDLVFFYHSQAKPAAVVGVAEVVREAYPDPTAFDTKNEYYDAKSKRDDPTWFMVDLRAVEALPRPAPIDEIKKTH